MEGYSISNLASGDSKLQITNSNFIKNRAFYLSSLTYQSELGRSISLSYTNEAFCLHDIVHFKLFRNNYADIGGNAI